MSHLDLSNFSNDAEVQAIRDTSGNGSANWSVIKAAPLNPKWVEYGAKGDGATDDTAALTAMFATLNAASSGEVYFPPGIYVTSGGHSLNVPCKVSGAGFGTIGAGNGASVLSLKNGANASLLTLAAKAITIENLGLYGNKGNQASTSHGIAASASVSANYFRLRNIWVDSFHDDGLFLIGPGSSLEGIAHGLRLQNNGAHGLNVSAGSAADCQFTDCITATNVLSGAWVNAGDTVFTNCHMWGNGTSTAPPTANDVGGLFMPSGAAGYLRITGGYYESNGNSTAGGRGLTTRGQGNIVTGAFLYLNRAQGLYAFSNTNLTVQGSVVRNNNLNAAAGSSGAGILFDTCTASSVTGSQMFDTQGSKTQTYGYAENGTTCNACAITGNVSRAADHLTGNWLTGASGTPTVVTGNVG